MKIDINNLSKYYKNREKTTRALKNINLTINKGEIVCILGHNGAGKTTLIKSICGLLKPDEGRVCIDEKVVHENLSFAHGKCGTVLEGSRNIYYYLTAYENLCYFGLLNGLNQKQIDKKAKEYLKMFDMEQFRNVPANSFSRGMQQKIAIMIALMKEPEILILDEPTLGLDIISTDAVIRILKELASTRNLSIIVTTHDIHLIEELNSRLIFMNHGEVVCDSKLIDLKQGEIETRYKITFLLKEDGVQLPEDAIISEKKENIFIFETKDYKWVKCQIASEQLIQIEKCSQSITEIYKEVMESNE